MSLNNLPTVPSVTEYIIAFRQIQANLTSGQIAMLRLQYTSPGHTSTSTQLANAAGYKNFKGANLQYGRIGTMLREALNFWGDGQASYVLSYFRVPDRANKGEWSFIMHEEVAQALSELKWFS